MSNRRFEFAWFKDYFKNNYPLVREVEVEAHKEAAGLFEVRARVKANRKWYVVRKRAASADMALNKAKAVMASKLHKEWNKSKRHPLADGLAA